MASGAGSGRLTARRPLRQALARAWFLALLAATAFWAREAQPAPGTFIPHHQAQLVPGNLVVRFRPEAPESLRQAVLAAHGATLERQMLLDGYAAVSVPPGREEEIGRALAATWAVRSAEESPLRIPYTHDDPGAPNDEYYYAQWNMRGRQPEDERLPLESVGIDLEPAWDLADGAGVVVAVVDTGVAYEDYHDPVTNTDYGRAPDLAGTAFTAPYDFFDGDDHPNDDFGHGTHVAGTIAQNTNNGLGVVGIAPGATLMPVKVCGYLPPELTQYGCPPDAIADGVTWAVNHGADIINLSLGSPGTATEAERDAVARAVQARVVVVGAAGNGGSDLVGDPQLDFPAALPGVISVGGAGTGGEAASYSNYSPELDLVAPGGDPSEQAYILQNSYGVPCATPLNFTSFWYCNRYGTSMAAAHVSGVAALMLSRYPAFKPSRVRILLTNCALDVGPPGFDDRNGFGLLQAYNALKDVNPYGRPNGALDGLEDVDRDGAWDCVDPEVDPVSPPPDTCDAPTPTAVVTASPLPETPALQAPAPAGNGPTASPSPTGTPTGTATETPTGTPTGTATETPTATPLATATGTPEATGTPAGTPTETPTPEPAPTDAATATPEPTPEPTVTPSATPAAQLFACGDTNCDNRVDARDALLIIRWSAHRHSNTALQAQGMDLHCLGNGYVVTCAAAMPEPDVAVADALAILRYMAGLPLDVPAGCVGIG